VANRHLGAFGFPAPYGHHPIGAPSISFNMDLVGGAVGSLCAAYRDVVRSDEAGHWVNLLFDHATPGVTVESPYTHPKLRVRVTGRRPRPLWVRLPSWADRSRLAVDGAAAPPREVNGYLFFAEPPLNRWLTVDFPLPEQEIVLHHRTRDIRARLRGDAVLAMDDCGADLTFFDAIE
jgi:hypothetical protein